jgi:hypothetical protein
MIYLVVNAEARAFSHWVADILPDGNRRSERVCRGIPCQLRVLPRSGDIAARDIQAKETIREQAIENKNDETFV